LCFACGIALETSYSSSASGSVSNEIHRAFVNNMSYVTADLSSATEGFYNELENSMKQGLSALLSVQSENVGHAIICDGYNVGQ